MTDANVAPPLFTSVGGGNSAPARAMPRGNAVALNLDDIFGDVMFTPDGDTVFASEESADGGVLNSGEGDRVATHCTRLRDDGTGEKVQNAGGISTTQLVEQGKPALTMGRSSGSSTAAIPFHHNPQAGHQLQYAVPKKKKSSSSSDRKMSEQQKSERR